MVSGLFPAHLAGRFKQILIVGLYIAICGTSESKTFRQLLSQYWSRYKYFALRELKFSSLIPDVPRGYVVTDCDEKYSLNVLIVPIDSKLPCGPGSNLNLDIHIWDTYMFSFYKYAALLFPSIERVGYIKDPSVESDGWLSPACSYCRRVFEYLYRNRAECLSTERCQCKVCVRQPATLKGAASDIAFRYVLNLEAFRIDPKVPNDRFNVVICKRVSEYRFFPYVLPCIMTACYCKEKEEAVLRFHPKYLYADPPPPIECDWL